MLAPSDCFNKLGKHKCKLIHVSGFANYLDAAIQDLVMPADIIIFQRNLVIAEVYDAMEYYQAMGKPVVVDLDDAYTILPWSNPAHAFWIENSTQRPVNPVVMLEEGLRRSNGLLAPNRLLLQDWQHVTKGYYLPNFARSEWWTGLPSRVELKKKRGFDNRVIIGWGGSVSHYDSWWGSGIREAASRVSQRHPEVLWLVCGNDKRIYDQLHVPWASKAWQPGVEPSQWPQVVSCFDIGIAPLSGPYDQRRSWIKGLEYLLGGIPWVGTDGEPYKDIAQLGYLIQNGIESWEYTLEMMLANLPGMQEASAHYIETARQWLVENQQETYEKTYREIIRTFQTTGRLAEVYYVNWKDSTTVSGVEGVDRNAQVAVNR